MVSHLLDSGKIIPIFLDELPSDASPALKLMVLTTLEGETAISAAKQALAQDTGNRDIIEMVTTIMVYKFTQLTRAEVDAMLGVTLQETRVYQEAKAEGKLEGKAEGKLEGKAEGKLEGKAEGKLEMLLMLLSRNLGLLPASLTEQIEVLSIEQLESLCTAAFDFQSLSDLTAWLSN
jgi:predicted transposase YdaD